MISASEIFTLAHNNSGVPASVRRVEFISQFVLTK